MRKLLLLLLRALLSLAVCTLYAQTPTTPSKTEWTGGDFFAVNNDQSSASKYAQHALDFSFGQVSPRIFIERNGWQIFIKFAVRNAEFDMPDNQQITVRFDGGIPVHYGYSYVQIPEESGWVAVDDYNGFFARLKKAKTTTIRAFFKGQGGKTMWFRVNNCPISAR